MREIKFRGLRDTELGEVEFVYGNVSMNNNQNCVYYDTHPDRIHWCTESGGGANAPVRKGTVGQYTGLKDKNGKEIYEGDVITYQEEPHKMNAEVVWKNGGFVFVYEGGNENITSESWYAPMDVEITEIIGNIYQNSELIIHEQ